MLPTTVLPTSNAPAVSVVIATYNWSTVLHYAIKSVLRQSLQDFEILVIGDGCTDDSETVVASFGDPRIHWHNLPENTGHQSIPNNTGISMAQGKYIAYLGHDDLWLSTHLEQLVHTLEAHEADGAYSMCILVGPPGTGVRRVVGTDQISAETTHLWIPPSSLMHKRDLTSEIGGWPEYRTTERNPESDLILRTMAAGKRFAPVGDITVIKFPSVWRPNAYRNRQCNEQADYERRMQDEANFLHREMLDVVRAYVADTTKFKMLPPQPRVVPAGWEVEQMRRLRGVEPRPLPALTAQQQMKRLYYGVRDPLGKIKRKLLRMLRGKP